MKKGVIITNAFYKSAGQQHKVDRCCDELTALGINVTHITAVSCGYVDGKAVAEIPDCDFVLYLDKDRHVAHLLEQAGYRLFNSALSMQICDDKMATYLALCNQGVKMPKTISAPLNYTADNYGEEFIGQLCEKISFPVVVKKCYGSFGGGVFLAHDRKQLQSLYEELRYEPLLFQEYVACSSGRDTRVIVIGGKTVAAMERVNEHDFRSNIEQGAVGYPVDLPETYRVMAEKCAKLLKLDYCGVDILHGENGEPILCEINSNAYFEGIEKVTGVNVAAAYSKYIFDEIYGK